MNFFYIVKALKKKKIHGQASVILRGGVRILNKLYTYIIKRPISEFIHIEIY